MEHAYDPTVKTLAELSPPDWLTLTGRRRRRVTVEDSDASTVISGATDKLFRVHDKPEYLLHLDFESGHFRSVLPLRLRLYNSLFEYRHDRVVLSVPVLLTPDADSPQWNGLLERGLPGESPSSTLRYQVIRVWELPVERLLTGGIGTLPLAPISDVPESDVGRVIRQMKKRLGGPKPPPKANDVWAAAYVLLGLRYDEDLANALFDEVLGMEESATYRAIVRKGREAGLEEGRAEEARRVLLLQGELKFGAPDTAIRAMLEGTSDVAQLEKLAARLMSAGSWQELLPRARPHRNGRRKAKE
jgi:predicted transposase YdaD